MIGRRLVAGTAGCRGGAVARSVIGSGLSSAQSPSTSTPSPSSRRAARPGLATPHRSGRQGRSMRARRSQPSVDDLLRLQDGKIRSPTLRSRRRRVQTVIDAMAAAAKPTSTWSTIRSHRRPSPAEGPGFWHRWDEEQDRSGGQKALGITPTSDQGPGQRQSRSTSQSQEHRRERSSAIVSDAQSSSMPSRTASSPRQATVEGRLEEPHHRSREQRGRSVNAT